MFQRAALQMSGSYADYFFNRSGYENTSKDRNDPNRRNNSEFGLASEDSSKSYYVTPLTPRGSSSQIVALGALESFHINAGKINSYVVNKYSRNEQRQANSSAAARITGEVLSGYKAQGLTVFEVVPNKDGNWTASIGKSQTILYRADIAPDGSVTLHKSSEAKKMDGDNDDSDSKDKTDKEPELKFDKPIDKMNVKELKEAGNEILTELSKRAANSD